jgi:type IV secretory pathway VirB2 component (pilin)
MKKTISILNITMVAMAIVALSSNPAFADLISTAQSTAFGSGLYKFFQWVQGIAAVICLIGVVVTGVQFAMGNDQAPDKLKKFIIGIVLVVASRILLSAIAPLFGE